MNQVRDFWDKVSTNYDKTEKRFEYIHNRSRERAKKHLKVTDVVLDYGCGTGSVSCELAHLVKEIHAIDISIKMIEIARQRVASLGVGNVSLTQTHLFTEKHGASSFDVVLVFNMLHTIPDPQGAVRKIYELLRPGGVFISATPCLQEKTSIAVGMQIRFARFLSKLGAIPIEIRRVKASALKELIEDPGFQVVEAEKIYSGASSYFVAAKKAARN